MGWYSLGCTHRSRYDAAMRIVMVASECEPFAKTGGLADVVDALSRALGRRGHEVTWCCRTIAVCGHPPAARSHDRERAVGVPAGPAPRRAGDTARWTSWTGRRKAIDCDSWTTRTASTDPTTTWTGAPTTRTTPPNSRSWRVPPWRASRLDGQPVDVLHGHDWEAGRRFSALRAARPWRPGRAGGGTGILTCHNLAYHGWIAAERAWQLGDLAAVARRVGVPKVSISCERASGRRTSSTPSARASPASRSARDGRRRGRPVARARRSLLGHRQRHRHRALGPGHRRHACRPRIGRDEMAGKAAAAPTWRRATASTRMGRSSAWSAGSIHRRASTC